jgi:WhiB family redox-sensing transcriptional regulator
MQPVGPRQTDWMGRALCRHADADIWFPAPNAPARDAQQVTVAKAICRGCPVKDDCLKDARERGEEFGIWGGVLFYVASDHTVVER